MKIDYRVAGFEMARKTFKSWKVTILIEPSLKVNKKLVGQLQNKVGGLQAQREHNPTKMSPTYTIDMSYATIKPVGRLRWHMWLT